MIATIEHQGRRYIIDLEQPIDISLPLHAGENQVRAWYVDPVRMEPVLWKGHPCTVKDGSATNFRNIFFNPHGHGTHTESVGHIDRELTPVGPLLKRWFWTAQLISVRPEERRAPDERTDRVITLSRLRELVNGTAPEALVIRTLPNEPDKRSRDWCHTNPAYLEAMAASWLRSIGVQHLLLDLPSVDREEDDGAMAAHKAFWGRSSGAPEVATVPPDPRTITELIFVPDEVRDGAYMLDLQFPHFMNDAAPSRPVLYALTASR